MTTVLITGWNIGFQKVEFTRLMKSALGLSLHPAKKITDGVLAGEQIELQVSGEQAEQLLAAMTDLGAVCEALVPQH